MKARKAETFAFEKLSGLSRKKRINLCRGSPEVNFVDGGRILSRPMGTLIDIKKRRDGYIEVVIASSKGCGGTNGAQRREDRISGIMEETVIINSRMSLRILEAL